MKAENATDVRDCMSLIFWLSSSSLNILSITIIFNLVRHASLDDIFHVFPVRVLINEAALSPIKSEYSVTYWMRELPEGCIPFFLFPTMIL
jgi:hypothetical protein